MAILTAEVIGKFDDKGNADKLVYAPIGGDCTYQKTRVYSIDYQGASNDAEEFVTDTLLIVMLRRSVSPEGRSSMVSHSLLITA